MLDETDVLILKLLKENARASVSEVGSRVGLSVSAAGERIKKLEASGVIAGYTAIIDGKVFRKELTAFMFVSLEHPRHIDGFVKFVGGEPDILECHYIAGNFDYILKIITNNPSTLEKLLNKIKGVSGVMKTFTNVVLATGKIDYSVSPVKL